ncbi:MAG: CoA ester lyase [Rhodobacteraceae bacterium]|nr:CoA ester lyase [Paracoccaceae bacterium]
MDDSARPYRSVLYIPGSRARAIDKARGLSADALILDLEDAVAPAEKAAARATVAAELARGGFGARSVMVRVNGLDSPWGREDVAALADVGPEAILLPKVEGAADVAALAALLDAGSATARTRIWAMMETPLGVLSALEIARAPRMAGMVLGTNDLAKDLGCRFRADRLPLLGALQTCLLAARAAGILAIDGVYNAFRDTEGLRAECLQGRDMGFDGKTLIHPDQLAVTNEVFAPDAEEIALARRQIAAFEEASARGEGVAVVDGRIVENLHIVMARRLLERAGAIASMERAG